MDLYLLLSDQGLNSIDRNDILLLGSIVKINRPAGQCSVNTRSQPDGCTVKISSHPHRCSTKNPPLCTRKCTARISSYPDNQ